jgi:hypothetical protein
MYKLIVNKTNVYEGGSLIMMIRKLNELVTKGDTVDIYRQAKTQWRLEDGCMWGA